MAGLGELVVECIVVVVVVVVVEVGAILLLVGLGNM